MYNIKFSVSDQCSVSGLEIYLGPDAEHSHERLVRGGEVRSKGFGYRFVKCRVTNIQFK
jgi:hypothetical protein